MSIKSERVKKWRKATKQKLINAFGGRCCICGYNKSSRALVLHHVVAEEKEFHWGKINGSIRGWNTIVEEMKKCVLLCSNCHAEIHDGTTNIPQTAQRFDETLIRKELQPKKSEHICRICGNQCKRNTRVCSSDCRTKTRIRKVDWSKVDVLELVNQYKNFEIIGDLLGVTGGAVARKYKQIKKTIPW